LKNCQKTKGQKDNDLQSTTQKRNTIVYDLYNEQLFIIYIYYVIKFVSNMIPSNNRNELESIGSYIYK